MIPLGVAGSDHWTWSSFELTGMTIGSIRLSGTIIVTKNAMMNFEMQ